MASAICGCPMFRGHACEDRDMHAAFLPGQHRPRGPSHLAVRAPVSVWSVNVRFGVNFDSGCLVERSDEATA